MIILDKNQSIDEIIKALNGDGAVIVANLVDDEVVDKVLKELRPHSLYFLQS